MYICVLACKIFALLYLNKNSRMCGWTVNVAPWCTTVLGNQKMFYKFTIKHYLYIAMKMLFQA
jgi:hypothetical protein